MVNLLTEHLDIWATAQTPKAKGGRGRGKKSNQSPHGIKKLRELILELAVRGKLVPQDPNDESASVLLEKIAQEKARLIKEGKIKKQKNLLEICEDEKPFGLPTGWEWTRLGGIALAQAGFAFKSKLFNENEEGLPLIRIRDVGQPFSGTYYSGVYREEFLVKNGDYLISMDGQFRVALWLNDLALLNQRVTRLIFFDESVGQRFVADSLQARLLELQGVKAYTTVDHLSGMQISEAIIALPPLAEQRRIVAKVDELMALCDQLEQQQTDSNTTHQTLLETLLATLTNAADQEEFAKAWQRIANHFDTLFTTEQSIDQLKQTILQLAVMGNLVPQNPNDEPASVLLGKIAKEKKRLVKEGKIKKQKTLPEISEDEKPYGLPQGWEWVRFGDVLNLISDYHANGSYKTLKTNVDLLDDEDYAIMLRTTNFSELNRESYKYITEKSYDFLAKSKVFEDDIIMNKIGDPGSCFFVDDRGKPMSLAMNLFLLRSSSWIYSKFAYLYLSAQCKYVKSFAGGTSTQTITKDAVNNLIFPLCPNKEQEKIISKVDELMAFCDTLKTCLNDAQATQNQLADAIVDQPSVATLTKEKQKQKKKPDEEDVQFIFDDVLKFSIMDFEDYKTHLENYPEDKLHHINLPEPKFGLFHISYESSERFHALTRRLLKSKSNEIHRCDIDESELNQSIRDTFAQFFILDRKPIEQKFVDRMLNRALRTTRTNHATITHYLPCVIVSKNGLKEFCLGVVRFIQTDKFFEEYDAQIETDLESQSREKRKNALELIDRGKLAGPITSEKEWDLNRKKTFVWIHEYYEQYDWIAEVTVPSSDPKVSRRRAELVVQASIDFLKAVFGSYGATSIRLGHNSASPNKTASLIRPADGQFEWGISYSSNNGVYVEDNWFEHMRQHYGAFLDVGSEVIQTLLSPDQATELCERWLDALNWYGQAVSEPLPSAQIVKYTAALERLTITQKTPLDSDRGVTESVTRRTAILSVGDQQEFFETICKDAREVYAWRSKLMHGRSSPSSKDEFVENEMRTVQSKADKLTRDALFGALIDYRKLLIGRKTDSKDLEEWFQKHEGQRL